MQLNEIVAPTMKELFIKEIIKLILSGQLAPGDKLLTEREMAVQMKVSRTIINLGMSELASMGFIEIIPRKGAYVADYIKKGKLDTLISIVNFNGGRFDKKTLDSIMQFRKLNESEGTYLCAMNRTQNDVDELKDIYTKIIEEKDTMEIGRLVYNFHHTILCASGNNIFPLVYNAFESILIKLISSVFTFCDGEFVIKYLGGLVDSIEKQDGEKARKLIEGLLSEGIVEVDKNYLFWFN